MPKEGKRPPSKRKHAILPIGIVIKNKWKITHRVGSGAFGEVVACRDLHTNQEVAIKVEKLDQKKMVLKLEVIALKRLQPCPHVVRYIHSGRQDDFNFLVMERLGANIAELRKRMPEQKFSMCTTLKLGMQMIEALEGVHKLGYIHRDVKPSNYVIGKTKSTKHLVYLIDFGLARKYRLPSLEIRPPRKHAGFRGTARYASINSHKCKELGRRDDLWSIFYVLVEFVHGMLPWRKVKSKEKIGELKEQFTNANLVKDLPDEYRLIMEHLQTLNYADDPDYSYINNLLKDVMVREGYSMDAPFDWEKKENQLPPVKQVPAIADDNRVHYSKGSTPGKKSGTNKNPSGQGDYNFTDLFQNNNGNKKGNGKGRSYQNGNTPSEDGGKSGCCGKCSVM